VPTLGGCRCPKLGYRPWKTSSHFPWSTEYGPAAASGPPEFPTRQLANNADQEVKKRSGNEGFNLATGKRKQQTANAESLSEKILRWMGGTGHEFL
jgi:hypothetical protein